MSEDLDAFFQDEMLTKSVVSDGITTVGILDMPDQILSGGLVESTGYSLLVKTSEFPLVVAGQAFTVDGEEYVSNSPTMKIDDGALSRIGLSKV